MIDSTFHLPIGHVLNNGHESVCLACFEDLVILGEPGEPLYVLEYASQSPGHDAGLIAAWDKTGRLDGWISLRPHVCTDRKE